MDEALGVSENVPPNGRIIRNLIQGANYIMSHITHFYHLCALDYVDVTSVAKYEGKDPALNSVKRFIERGQLAPFVPRYEGDYRLPPEVDQAAVAHYVQALDMRREAHEMLAIFGGHMPHNMAVVPGGATENVTIDKIADFLWRLNRIREFIDNVYIPDVLAVAGVYSDYFAIGGGVGNYLSYGVFDQDTALPLQNRKRTLMGGSTSVAGGLKYEPLDPSQITEDVSNSWYSSGSGLHPSKGETVPQVGKNGAYSWIKAPRYKDEVYEVGPLARMAVSYVDPNGPQVVKDLINSTLAHFNADVSALVSTLGRHAARALECKVVADSMAGWLLEMAPGGPVYMDHTVPDSSEGHGMWDAPRGALYHYVKVEGGKIANYQCVVPGTWNNSPRDDKGRPGPVEAALTGAPVKDVENPFEIVRIVRSFDPCIACAVHLVTPKGRELGRFRVL